MKTRYRIGWFGKLILQVGKVVDVSHYDEPFLDMQLRWRDATIEDLQELNTTTKHNTIKRQNPWKEIGVKNE